MYDLPLVKFNNLNVGGGLEILTMQPQSGDTSLMQGIIFFPELSYKLGMDSLFSRMQYFWFKSFMIPIVLKYGFTTNEIYYRHNPEALKANNRVNEDMWISERVNGLKQATQQPQNIEGVLPFLRSKSLYRNPEKLSLPQTYDEFLN